ncbi:MAG TPA: Holliday junction branch migration protein RuvA [Syntrophorhabdales bacterium]|nr:Holliday junction branch migration protein RuvA [Syntrophorhabdales bacterium]
MISYLDGTLKKIYSDRVTIGVGGVGYEVLIPAYVMNEIRRTTKAEDPIKLYISFNQTERQPKPVLVGFRAELDKEFFELFITVEDIGPSLAIRALTQPVREIARYIEEKSVRDLRRLKGIGERKAEKIVAALKGKAAKFALIPQVELPPETPEDFKNEVENVLVIQLGHKLGEARRMIEEAMTRRPTIGSSEELFEEVYRGQKK